MVPPDSGGVSPAPPYSGSPPLRSPCPYGALTLCGAPSQAPPVLLASVMQVLQPRPCRDTAGLGCSAFARHYLRNHSCFLFLRVLRCFSSPGFPKARPSAWRVVPFGYLRIKGHVRLPAAFRSLPRPSSSPGAQASPVRPLLFLSFRACGAEDRLIKMKSNDLILLAPLPVK